MGNSKDGLRLVVLPALKVPRDPILLTRKLRTGLDEYARRWPGTVEVCLEPRDDPSDDVDHEPFDASAADFEVLVAPVTDPRVVERIRRADVVLGALISSHQHLAKLCSDNGVRFVPVAEYTLETRLKITRAERPNRLRRWRRYVWELGQERAIRASLRWSAGVQCNGLPTFRVYEGLTPSPLLFFDGRVTRDMLATEQERHDREQRILRGDPIHMFYFGRLVDMKGPMDLIEVARVLREMQVPFRLTIAGGGPLEASMRARIESLGLEDTVQLLRPLPFAEGLMPLLRKSGDLAIFCHPQGDPSCSYTEAMSAGLPIAGYDNESLGSLVARAPVGWATPMQEPEALARRIAGLHARRPELARASASAFEFAAENTFERTMDARVEHLRALLDRAPPTR